MRISLLLLFLTVFACSEKKADSQPMDQQAAQTEEVAMSDSTNQAIDSDLSEIDAMLKEIE